MRNQRVIVVGAGIGGLVSALELAAAGMEVLVLERAGGPGGKMREVRVGGHAMDAGPTLFTMRWVFDGLFADIGASLDDAVTLLPAGILARHAWSHGAQLDLFADSARSAEAIGIFAGPREARGFLEFCKRAAAIYESLKQPFLRGSRPGPAGLIARAGWAGLPGLLRISPFASLWDELGRYFRDPRLRQLFGRYATYCGSSPFQAPATLMLVAHVEQQGVWLVQGGMYRIATALEHLAQQRGARFFYNSGVSEIRTRCGRATGVRLTSGEELAADTVVFNGDISALAAGLLGSSAASSVVRRAESTRSLSAVTLNMLAPVQGFPLLRHSVFFSSDYAAEFQAIFRDGAFAADPTVYVCAQDRNDGCKTVQAGLERLLCIVNAPPSGDRQTLDAPSIARLQQGIFNTLVRCGLDLQVNQDQIVTTTPADFDALFPGTGGALYGQASHGWRASFSRPGARSLVPGLYLAGGSTHPGPGVPMAALSGRQVAAAVKADIAALVHRGRQ